MAVQPIAAAVCVLLFALAHTTRLGVIIIMSMCYEYSTCTVQVGLQQHLSQTTGRQFASLLSEQTDTLSLSY